MTHFGWKSILFIIFAVSLFVWATKGMILASYLSSKLRLPISIEWADLWRTETVMYRFKIKNPKGFKEPRALFAETVAIHYQLSDLVHNPSLVDRVYMNKVRIYVELIHPPGTENNWNALSVRMPKILRGHGIDIKSLIVNDLSIIITSVESGKVSVKKVDRIVLKDIGKARGFPTEEIVQEIFSKSGLAEFIENAFDPGQVLEQALEPEPVFGDRMPAAQ